MPVQPSLVPTRKSLFMFVAGSMNWGNHEKKLFSSDYAFGMCQHRLVWKPIWGPKLSKEQFRYSKCIDKATVYRERLTYDELCRYGQACPSVKSHEKYESFCLYRNLSECFEHKAWKTSYQLLGLPSGAKIGLVTQELAFKNGVGTGKTCGYYN